MNIFGVRWHSQFQHYYGRDGVEDCTAVFDSMVADEFERDYKNGDVINIEAIDLLSQQPEPWLSIQDDNNTLVTEEKPLHELTWVQKKVAVKGVPLPDIRRTSWDERRTRTHLLRLTATSSTPFTIYKSYNKMR
ncbi:hypothetical protein IV203_025578 [Nitzschia inconspicua]|uniref:Uncharacterized protein n=1 Tax=Nitzschia inconspicua TaxID=303405 RepID=A0A9K3LH10_9STRA|nr:hypothetical protein IV203_017646 [Nitzschia inconspicua]KAG7339904.1 hypothetical protein IV203_024954 [Nitzschia inconspicua]KAG7361912.1 hypothetical protein IV203_025578 [Nitzschia inconspicua]